MGSSLCTVAEAATRLKRSKRMVWKYIEKGFLTRVPRDGKVFFQRDEVEQLAVELGADMPALTRHTFFQLMSRVQRLEEQMAMVRAVWGSEESPLRPKEKEAAGLYKAATDYLCQDSWDYQQLRSWADIFVSVDEGTLEILAGAAMTTKPWEPLFELASRMALFLSKDKDLKRSIDLQALKAKLELGRKKVREASLLWIESGRGTVPNRVFKLFDTPEEDLLRSLKVRGQITTPSSG